MTVEERLREFVDRDPVLRARRDRWDCSHLDAVLGELDHLRERIEDVRLEARESAFTAALEAMDEAGDLDEARESVRALLREVSGALDYASRPTTKDGLPWRPREDR